MVAETPTTNKPAGLLDTLLGAALAYAGLGWHVMPDYHITEAGFCSCASGEQCGRSSGKHPRIKDWTKNASADADQVRRWWRKWPQSNVGILTGPDSGIFDLDVEEEGLADLAALLQANTPFPPTPSLASGHGGRHYLFRWPDGGRIVLNGSHLDKRPIDTRGRGGQFVAPPSRNTGGQYVWLVSPLDTPPAEAPEWLLAWLAENGRVSLDTAQAGQSPRPHSVFTSRVGGPLTAEQRAILYVSVCPEAISGQGGHNQTFRVARALVYGFNLGRERGLQLLLEHYNPRCRPEWTEKELAHKVRDAEEKPFDKPCGWLLQEQAVQTSRATTNGRAQSNGHFDHKEHCFASAPKDWEQPIPFSETPAEPFPLGVLCPALAEMAQAIALSMPCPVDMPACMILAAASSAMGSLYELKVKTSWYEQARLWIAVVSRTGSKKSPAAGCALRPVRQQQQRMRREYEQALSQHEKDLEAWQAADKEERGEKPHAPIEHQVFTSDVTQETLPDLLSENPRGLLLHRDELTGWVKALNQYKGGRGDDRQAWLSYWSGEDVVVNRRRRRVYVRQPFLSVCGNLPPAVLSDLHDEQGREDGFIHRILFSWPAHAKGGWSECEPDPDTITAYDQFFERLYALKPHMVDGCSRPYTVTFEPEAKSAFAEFVNRLASEQEADNFPENLRGPWSKMEGYCARFALLLHVCDNTATPGDESGLSLPTVQRAIKLANYFLAHARRVYPFLTGEGMERRRQDAEAVLEWIRRNREKIEDARDDKPANAFTWRTVRHDLHGRFEGREADLAKALQDLEARGFLQEMQRERQGNVGRAPRPNYFVNPSTWRNNDQNDRNGGGEHPQD